MLRRIHGAAPGSDPFFVMFVVIRGRAISVIPYLGSQVLDLSAELGRFVHGRFCTAEQTANAVRVAEAKRLHKIAECGDRQASSQPSRYVAA